jgi:hypothetical protein
MRGIIAVRKELLLQSKYTHKGNMVQAVCHIGKDYVAKQGCYQARPENISCMNREYPLYSTSSVDDLITILKPTG